MNWTEIKEKYPKAFNNLIEIWNIKTYKCTEFELISNNAVDNKSCNIIVNDRDLYYFFDNNEILISVANNGKESWFWDVENYKSILASWEESSNTRIEAEQTAFKKAFELLEKQLK